MIKKEIPEFVYLSVPFVFFGGLGYLLNRVFVFNLPFLFQTFLVLLFFFSGVLFFWGLQRFILTLLFAHFDVNEDDFYENDEKN